MRKRFGFTLAEVLITLGIIGVVAALTIPTLMHSFQKRVLKTQFKKVHAAMSQNLLSAINDFGGDIKSYCTTWAWDDSDNGSFINRNECVKMFDNYFKIVGECKYKSQPQNYAKNNKGYMDIGASLRPSNLLADGTCYQTVVNSYEIGFTFDINGPDKGPNALGHDIFAFHVDDNDSLIPVKMTGTVNKDELDEYMTENCPEGSNYACGAAINQKGYPCTRTSNQQGNGLGCTWYAVNDICPDDETKGYWECLP